MGFGLNSTLIPVHDNWSGYLVEAQKFLPDSASRVALLTFINIPVIVIVLNVLRQLVRLRSILPTFFAADMTAQVLPKDRTIPPEVFHLVPFLGSAPGYGNDPVAFLESCRKKVRGYVLTRRQRGQAPLTCITVRGCVHVRLARPENDRGSGIGREQLYTWW
jgi:sterol 14-demethylase